MKAYDLQRFKDAQHGEFENALAELRAGRKQSHWIWYVFPQLRGLGSSPYAVRYGLDGPGEASAYLSDPLLRQRYLDALSAVHDQLIARRGRLERVMGSHIDALKLVSSLTLFEQTAQSARETPNPDLAAGAGEIAGMATEVLDVAEKQGFPRCAFTLQRCGKGSE